MKKFLLSCAACAVAFGAGIEVSDAYAKTTMPGMAQTAIFMHIANSGDKPVKLIGAKSDLGAITELNDHKAGEDGSMAMIKVDSFEVPANGTFDLVPMGPHVMVLQLHGAVDESTTSNLTLEFDDGTVVELKDIGSKALDMGGMHGHGGHGDMHGHGAHGDMHGHGVPEAGKIATH